MATLPPLLVAPRLSLDPSPNQVTAAEVPSPSVICVVVFLMELISATSSDAKTLKNTSALYPASQLSLPVTSLEVFVAPADQDGKVAHEQYNCLQGRKLEFISFISI